MCPSFYLLSSLRTFWHYASDTWELLRITQCTYTHHTPTQTPIWTRKKQIPCLKVFLAFIVFPFSWYNYTYFNTLGTLLQCYWGCFPYFNYKVLSWHSGIALDHPEYFFVCNKEHNLIIPLTYYVHLPRQFWLYGPVTYCYKTWHYFFTSLRNLFCLFEPKANNFVANFLGRPQCWLCALLTVASWGGVRECQWE